MYFVVGRASSNPAIRPKPRIKIYLFADLVRVILNVSSRRSARTGCLVSEGLASPRFNIEARYLIQLIVSSSLRIAIQARLKSLVKSLETRSFSVKIISSIDYRECWSGANHHVQREAGTNVSALYERNRESGNGGCGITEIPRLTLEA